MKAKFWLNVLTELKNRGLNDILIACVDGRAVSPDAINTVYPKAHPVMHRAYGAQQPALRVDGSVSIPHNRAIHI